MLDKDKLWVVFYLVVTDINKTYVPQYMNETIEHFKFDESVQTILIPVYDTDKKHSWVEILNPGSVSKKETESIEKYLNGIKWE